MTPIDSTISSFPMGPKLRTWLHIDDMKYSGHNRSEPSDDEVRQFVTAFLTLLEDVREPSPEQLTDIIEELIGMNLPELVVRMSQSFAKLSHDQDFRFQLHLGNALMMTGELVSAIDAFAKAQKIVPAEPAPYVNLAQIYCHEGQLDDALAWINAGLAADSNFLRLWSINAWILQQKNPDAPQKVLDLINEKAKILHSWAGASLSADLQPNDQLQDRSLTKVAVLEKFFHNGERSEEFLIEYTACLGLAGQYDKIAPILWQIEKSSDKPLHWQLALHRVQAFMGLGRDEEAREFLSKLEVNAGIPPEGHQVIAELKKELHGIH
jgi:tetratricopeptide (TPR) repeat protein